MNTRITTSPRLFILTVTFLISLPLLASAMPSQADEFVNDFANVISEPTKKDFSSRAAVIRENYNGTQIVVVTVNSLDGQTIENYANTLFNSWGLGDRKANNGLLFLIIPNGNPGSRLRIEVGKGLKKVIPDDVAGNILDQVLPYYNESDYSAVVAAGFDMITERIEDKMKVSKRKPQRNDDVSVGVVVFDIVFSIIVFIIALFTMLSCAFSGRASLKKVDKMGIADGDYTTEDKDITEKAEKKEGLLYWSSVPISIIVILVSVACGICWEGGVTPLGWIITAVCAIIAAIVFNRIKYSCPKCSSILEHAYVVDDEPTYNEEGKASIYMLCHKCGNKYVTTESVPMLVDYDSSSSYRSHGGSHGHHSHRSGGRSGGGGGRSRGGGASR